jgi:ComF family protein
VTQKLTVLVFLHGIFQDFLSLFLPDKCLTCSVGLVKNEKRVCKACLSKLAKTDFWKDTDNPVAQIFWGRLRLENAFSFYFFTKGGVLQEMVHQIKYRWAKDLAFLLGVEFGIALKNHDREKIYDMICPVPLHKDKQRIRGYNQSEWIALGMAEVLEIPVINNLLVRTVYTGTQTRKNKQQRWENVKNAFKITDCERISGKHILLLDDVLTTGATIEACAIPILDCGNARLSVATLAFAFDT